jgi:hypothetical protein
MHWPVIGGSFAFAVGSFVLLTIFNLPTMAIYGFVQGVGAMPHAIVPVVIGALIGKFYFDKKLGRKRFLEIMPVLLAGYGTGVGLIALLGVAANLIVSAVSSAPF